MDMTRPRKVKPRNHLYYKGLKSLGDPNLLFKKIYLTNQGRLSEKMEVVRYSTHPPLTPISLTE